MKGMKNKTHKVKEFSAAWVLCYIQRLLCSICVKSMDEVREIGWLRNSGHRFVVCMYWCLNIFDIFRFPIAILLCLSVVFLPVLSAFAT